MKALRNYLYGLIIFGIATVGALVHGSPLQGEGYFFVGFAYQDSVNSAVGSHTFGSFYRVLRGQVRDRVDISWLPARGRWNPRIGVPPVLKVDGENYSLEETVQFAEGKHMAAYGPFQISEGMFLRAEKRAQYLSARRAEYKMLPVFLRPQLRTLAFYDQPGGVLNCIMGLSDISGELFPTGDLRGFAATEAILRRWSPLIRRVGTRERVDTISILGLGRVLPHQVLWR